MTCSKWNSSSPSRTRNIPGMRIVRSSSEFKHYRTINLKVRITGQLLGSDLRCGGRAQQDSHVQNVFLSHDSHNIFETATDNTTIPMDKTFNELISALIMKNLWEIESISWYEAHLIIKFIALLNKNRITSPMKK